MNNHLRIKRFKQIAITFVCNIAFFLTAHSQYTLTVDDIVFDTLTGTITAYSIDSANIIIPASFNINGEDIIIHNIGANAFNSKSLTGVSFSNRLKTIGSWAFAYNNFSDISIPDSVFAIGERAFAYCSISNVSLPDKLTTIGRGIFYYNSLTSVTIPDSVTLISADAFAHNSLISVTIPDKVETIDRWAFSYNKLNSINIPGNVTDIREAAFNSNYINTVNGTISDGIVYSRNTDGSEDSTKIVSYGGASKNIDFISEKVTTIGAEAFSDDSLTSVTIPGTITTIEGMAFYMNLLTDITIPNSITSIESGTFGSNKLVSITFPNQLKTIGQGSFPNNLLTNVTFPNSVTTIGDNAFINNELISVTISNNTTYIGAFAFQHNLLASVTIPNSVISIGEYAFDDNPIVSISLPAPVIKEGHEFDEWQDGSGTTVTEVTDFTKSYEAQFTISGFVISGDINIDNNSGLSLNLTGEIIGSRTVSDIDGTFSFAVDSGRNITISPVKEGFSFSPVNITLIDLQRDTTLEFYAQYTISGTVTGAADVVITMSGDNTSSQTVSTDGGTYSFNAIHGQMVYLTPSKEGYSFSPESITVGQVNSHSDHQDFVATINTSTINKIEPGNIKVYPNPVNNILHVETDGIYSLEILNLNGKVLKNIDCSSLPNAQIDMSNHTSGLYLLKLISKDGLVVFKKIIKQ